MNNTNTDFGKLLLRITVGVLMLFHGIKKAVDGHDFVRMVLADKGLPEWLWVGVPVGEIIAPLLLIFGIFTRSAALIVGFTMIMAMYLWFGWAGFALNKFGAFEVELNLFFLLTAISIYFMGAGKYALSEKLFKTNAKLKNL